jgi:hypothetical protein
VFRPEPHHSCYDVLVFNLAASFHNKAMGWMGAQRRCTQTSTEEKDCCLLQSIQTSYRLTQPPPSAEAVPHVIMVCCLSKGTTLLLLHGNAFRGLLINIHKNKFQQNSVHESLPKKGSLQVNSVTKEIFEEERAK